MVSQYLLYHNIGTMYSYTSKEGEGYTDMYYCLKNKNYSECEKAIKISENYNLGIEFAGYITIGDLDVSLNDNKSAKINYEKALNSLSNTGFWYYFSDGYSSGSNIRKLIEIRQQSLLKSN